MIQKRANVATLSPAPFLLTSHNRLGFITIIIIIISFMRTNAE